MPCATEIHRDVKTEGKIGVIQLQAKEHPRIAGDTRKVREAQDRLFKSL